MELFLAPNNPERTILVSPNGVAHYQVTTTKSRTFAGAGRRYVTTVQRNADTVEDSIVGEIEWKKWGGSTLVKSVLLDEMDVKLKDFLYKRHQFSQSRYFVGNDGLEYRWKPVKRGFALTQASTNEAVANFVQDLSGQGLFNGERKSCLQIYPSLVDIDLVVLSFLIMEKKRRDHAGNGSHLPAHDDVPMEGGMEGGEC